MIRDFHIFQYEFVKHLNFFRVNENYFIERKKGNRNAAIIPCWICDIDAIFFFEIPMEQ